MKAGLDPKARTIRIVPRRVRKLAAWSDYCDRERALAAAIQRLGKV